MMIPVGSDLTSLLSAYQSVPVGMTMGGVSILMQEMYGGRGVAENGGVVALEDVRSSGMEGSTATTTASTEMEEEDSVFLHGFMQYQQQQQEEPRLPVLPQAPLPVLARQQHVEVGCGGGRGEGALMEGSSMTAGMMTIDPMIDDWLIAAARSATAIPLAPWKLQPCLDDFSSRAGRGVMPQPPGARDYKKKRRVEEDAVDDKAAIQKQKRMIKNRESAARSRERKQSYIEDLERLARRLKEENARLERRMEIERERIEKLEDMESKRRWPADRLAEEGRIPPRRLRRTNTL